MDFYISIENFVPLCRGSHWTVKQKDGWAVKREGNDRATSVHKKQADAWNETKQRAKQSGGEAYLQNRAGKIRERNTFGNDPRESKG